MVVGGHTVDRLSCKTVLVLYWWQRLHWWPTLRHNRPMNASELTALLVFCTAMSFSPGPNTTLSTALAANGGLKRALRFCLAVPTGWTLLMLATGLGLGALITGVPLLRWGVKLLGVAYMFWLAWQLAGASRLSQADPARLQIGFWQGVGLQFVNIKAWMLALTIVAGWIAGRDNALERLAIVLPVMLVYAFASNLLYASVGALLRHWLAQGRRLLWFSLPVQALQMLPLQQLKALRQLMQLQLTKLNQTKLSNLTFDMNKAHLI